MSHLSVIVIARNEEALIAQCLSSVVAAVRKAGGGEIVMVDSASTDRTVSIARSIGVRVLSLSPDLALSAAAGRFVGFHKTHGELVMFVDGDTVIDSEWLRGSITYFEQADVAGVMGYLDDFDATGRRMPYVGGRSENVQTTPSLRGIAMYRRSAMSEVGTFNPYVREDEEAELALRLRRNGWRLLKIPLKMGDHLRGDNILRLQGHLRWASIGRTLRYAIREGNGVRFLVERCSKTMAFVAAILLLIAGATLSFLGYRLIEDLTVVFVVGAILSIALKKRNWMGPLIYVIQKVVILWSLFGGLVTRRVMDPWDYPLDAVEEIAAKIANGREATLFR